MAASLFVFTSAQAEAACRAKPPSVCVPQAQVAVTREIRGNERIGRGPALNVRPQANNKTLNVLDLPEVLMSATSQHTRLVPKALRLPVLSEDDEIEDDIYHTIPHEASLEWTCHVCTFVNCGPIRQCEMCNTENGVTQPLEECAANTSVPLKFNDDWPSLDGASDAWEVCDAASIASSWLEIGDVGDDIEDVESEDGVVLLGNSSLPGHAPPKVLSWSARAAMLASKGDSSKTPGAHAILSSAWQRPIVKQQRERASKVETEEEDVQDPALDILEERRLRSRASRGVAQRQRARRK